MANKIPVKAIYSGADVTSLGELASGDTIASSWLDLSAGTGITISGSGVIAAGAISLSSVQTAANQSAHLALTTEAGDIVVRSDENKTYCHNGGSAGTMSDFTLLATPTDVVLSVGGNVGAVTNAHIAAAVEAASDSNTFTDADHTKLDAIEASADVTDTLNVTSAGALMDSELAGIAAVKATTGTFLIADQTKLDAIEANATADQSKSDIEGLGIAASSITGALPAIDGSSLTGITTDTTTIENNIAMLGFFRASDNSKAKYNLVDQVIDEYSNNSGIDTGNSTNEVLTSGVYSASTSTAGNASGGTTSTSGGYEYHHFTSDGDFVVPSSANIEVLMIGGGAAGGSHHGGGGGAGGTIYDTSLAVTKQTYALVVGTGGDANPTNQNGDNGTNSTGFGWIGVGGGGGGHYSNVAGSNGGMGGGGGGYGSAAGGQTQTSSTASSGTRTVYAYNGTSKTGASASDGQGGGAGGSAGQPRTFSNFSSFGGFSGAFAAGGQSGGDGGRKNSLGAGGGEGGQGGGGSGSAATDGTGSGGGGGGGGNGLGADGGNGVILIRYATNSFTIATIDDLTLQSTATTAESAPTTGDIVVLIEDAAGTATINTDVKAYISRDGTAFTSAVTLTDEGDWGTNKRILAAHDVDLSGITSGTAMKYKITTHNQSGSKETKIHATSLAWA